MDVSDLRVFEAVARFRNMNRAAEELNTVQSNVTARIRQLEHELSVRLFDRHSRGVEPTSAALTLLPYAIRLMSLVSDARKAVTDSGKPGGPLIIGSLETTLPMRLAPAIASFLSAYPDVDLTIRTGTTPELIDMVLRHEVEGAFVCGPVNHADLDETVFFKEELVLYTSRSVRSLEEVTSARRLKQLVLRAGCSYRQRLEDICARRGVVATRTLEFATLEAIVSSVSAGVGVTLLPKDLPRILVSGNSIKMHRLPAAESDVTTVFVRHRDSFVSSAQTTFLDYARGSSSRAQAAE